MKTSNNQIYEEPMIPTLAHLPEHLREVARQLGGGNLSAGIRLALERAAADSQAHADGSALLASTC